jgi:hypothetical protein
MILLGYQLYLSITFIEFLYHPNGVKLAKPKALLQGKSCKHRVCVSSCGGPVSDEQIGRQGVNEFPSDLHRHLDEQLTGL